MIKTDKILPETLNSGDDAGYRRRILAESFRTRILSLLVVFLCAEVLRRVFKISVPAGFFTVLTAWVGVSALYFFIFTRKWPLSEEALDRLHFTYYIPGVLASTFLAHYLGGSEWVAFAVYLFDLVYANMLLKRVRGVIVTGLVLISYFTLLLLEYNSVIPHYRLVPMYEAAYNNFIYIVITNIIVVGLIFVMLSYVVGLFSNLKLRREKDLIVARGRLELRSSQIKGLSDRLKVLSEENDMLRSRAEKYVREKEKSLDLVRSGLEEKLEIQSKTHRAMRLMIDDLNEMSGELKKVKAGLEDKVKKRAEELMEITERLHRNEKLAFIGQLAGSVTHELRNPLGVIRNAVYFLETKFSAGPEDKLTEYLSMIKKEVGIMDRIVSDIMGFAGTKPETLIKTDPGTVVESAVSQLNAPELISIVKDIEKVPFIMADPEQLTHAIVNMINNSIVAMNGNGEIVIRVREKDGYVIMEVSDTGVGIPEEHRKFVFEPLYSTRPKGTGLGLAIAKMMVEGQRGSIDFTSREGEGTTFTIKMPSSSDL
jgi:signal transduction histidine kinase